MNKVLLTGRLTNEPEIRYAGTDNSMAVASFSLAVNRRFAKRDDPNAQTADFPRCIAFGKPAEFVEKYFHKGMKADVEGRLQTGKYVNKDGQTVYTTDVIVENIEFGESKKSTDGNADSTGYTLNSLQDEARGNNGGGFQGGYQNPNQSFLNIPEGTNETLPFM